MDETTGADSRSGEIKTDSVLGSINAAAKTDVGKTRSDNQDSFCVIENDRVRFYAVADGMGGASGGGRASQLAIDTIQRIVESSSLIDESTLREAVRSAHEAIVKEAQAVPSLSGMGTTLVCLAFTNEAVFLLNVGDSRAYMLSGAAFSQLSEDHTVVAELLRSGTINDEQAKHTPVSHMLTRSLGAAGEVELDCWKANISEFSATTFLLCSDGLYSQVPVEELATLLAEPTVSEVPQKLIDRANSKGSPDNVTAIVIRIEEQHEAGSPAVAADVFKRIRLPSMNSASCGPSLSNSRLQVEKEVIIPASASVLAASGAAEITGDIPEERPIRSLRRLISVLSLAVVFGFGLAIGNLLPRVERAALDTPAALGSVSATSPSLPHERNETAAISIAKIGDDFDARKLSAEEAAEKLEQVRLAMDVATRRLLVWIDRQSRLQGQQMNELASEIAVTVPSVKNRWDAYQSVRAEYLRQAEELVYNPLDSAREAQVGQLEKDSAQRFEEVSSAVRSVVDETVAATLTEIAKLTRQRDRLQARLEGLRREASKG